MAQRFIANPTYIEAVHFNDEDYTKLIEFCGEGKLRIDPRAGELLLHAGVDGAQGWVTVPKGHWLVAKPGDRSDIWPVAPEYFDDKYRHAVDEIDYAYDAEPGMPSEGTTANRGIDGNLYLSLMGYSVSFTVHAYRQK